jgi:hypothetical protein
LGVCRSGFGPSRGRVILPRLLAPHRLSFRLVPNVPQQGPISLRFRCSEQFSSPTWREAEVPTGCARVGIPAKSIGIYRHSFPVMGLTLDLARGAICVFLISLRVLFNHSYPEFIMDGTVPLPLLASFAGLSVPPSIPHTSPIAPLELWWYLRGFYQWPDRRSSLRHLQLLLNVPPSYQGV